MLKEDTQNAMVNEYIENGFKQIDPRQVKDNPFQLIGYDWTLMTAEKNGVANTMTVAWGGLGFMWGKPTMFVAVRPERYTFEFSEAADTFSIVSFDMKNDKDKKLRKMLAYCGTISGRDEDKIKKSELTLLHEGETPYFAESRLVFICKKIMATVFNQNEICDPAYAKFYGGSNDHSGLGGGFHTLYIAQITHVFIKEGEEVLPHPKKQSPITGEIEE